jgi:tRNA(Arg) A34 adenosine deaminase TadA
VEWDEAWGGLGDAWRRAYGLAWEAFAEGSIAVGAVVLGPDGAVIAEGRNRAAGTEALPGQVVGAAIAHAEVNALAVVPRGTTGITLLSTLEPCFLCTAAARYAQVAAVRYAVADPVWAGVERIGELNDAYAKHPAGREEVDLGGLSTWGGGLALLSVVRWIASRTGRSAAEELADGSVATTIRAHQPAVAALAEALLTADLRPDPDVSPERALARWWPAVEDAGRRG